jgi:hypothetical protein
VSSIVELPKIISLLSPEEKKLFDRLFLVQESLGKLVLPKEMIPWADKSFGDHHSVEEQRIIKVFNRQSFESALFNELRARRPISATTDEDAAKTIKESEGDPFCKPLTGTPTDTFGRVRGWHCVSASNVAKYDALHGLIIFKQHNPLLFTEKDLADYLNTAMKWFERANRSNKEAVYPFLLWNCLWKAGASIIHGHMQTALGEGMHYGGAEYLNHVRKEYGERYASDYFSDLFRAHASVGLGLEWKKLKIFTSITPIKEKEITILGEKFDKKFMSAIFQAADCMVKELGVNSFNMGIIYPPMNEKRNKGNESGWKGFPVIARIVDRGKLSSKTSDFAGMEIYAGTSVIESDPYKVFESLKSHF